MAAADICVLGLSASDSLYCVTIEGWQKVTNSWFCAASYALIGVMIANLVIVDNAADWWGWIWSVVFAHISMIFMCTFSSNTTHVMTDHKVCTESSAQQLCATKAHNHCTVTCNR